MTTTSIETDQGGADDDVMPQDGARFAILFDSPEQEYRSAEGIAQSALKEMRLSPAHFRVAMNEGIAEEGAEGEETEPEEETKRSAALDIGTALHTAVLEPHEFNRIYVVPPADINLRTKDGKAWKLGIETEGKRIIKARDMAKVADMTLSIMEHPVAQLAVRQSNHEVAVFAPIDFDGVILQRKGRVDMMCNSGITLADIKTTVYGKGHPDSWGKAIADYGYHLQGAYYLDMCNAVIGSEQFTEFVHIVVEKDPPYAVSCYRLTEAALDFGRALYMKYLTKVAECTRKNAWPAYPEHLMAVELPSWVTKKPFDVLDL